MIPSDTEVGKKIMAEFERRLQVYVDNAGDIEVPEILDLVQDSMNRELLEECPGRWTYAIRTFHGYGPNDSDLIDVEIMAVHRAGMSNN